LLISTYLLQDLERRLAEAGSALRATQHALKMEHSRRTAAERGLDEAELHADQRRMEVSALRAEAGGASCGPRRPSRAC
jgi:chromosome segregation ATPase